MIRFDGRAIFLTLAASVLGFPLAATASAQDAPLLTGKAAFGDWHRDAPGVRRKISVSDLPRPYATKSADNAPRIIRRPSAAAPVAPPGFRVDLFASNLHDPRALRIAPNGDVFVVESAPGRIRVLRGREGQAGRTDEVFASGLDQPFGIAFYPLGSDPQWLYVANTGSVVRYPYRNGDINAAGPAEPVVSDLPHTAGHGVPARPHHARHRFL
jgi:glucose/arabinose dehydrogenase